MNSNFVIIILVLIIIYLYFNNSSNEIGNYSCNIRNKSFRINPKNFNPAIHHPAAL